MFHMIADIHGNVTKAIDLFQQRETGTKHIFLLGDIGFGFPEFDKNYFYEFMFNNPTINFYLIQGNHDNALEMTEKDNVKVISTVSGSKVFSLFNKKILLIPGALSFDKEARIEGLTWWNNEQMSKEQCTQTLKLAIDVDIILSHDAPLFSYFKFFYDTKVSLSNQMLNTLYASNLCGKTKKLWVHGHLHKAYFHKEFDIILIGLANDTCISV